MLKRLSGSFVGTALFSALCFLPVFAAADPLRESYVEDSCMPAARVQLKVGKRGSRDGTRVAERLCECAADRAESAGWVLPEFPARDAEACLSYARGFAAVSPFAPLAFTPSKKSQREAREAGRLLKTRR